MVLGVVAGVVLEDGLQLQHLVQLVVQAEALVNAVCLLHVDGAPDHHPSQQVEVGELHTLLQAAIAWWLGLTLPPEPGLLPADEVDQGLCVSIGN